MIFKAFPLTIRDNTQIEIESCFIEKMYRINFNLNMLAQAIIDVRGQQRDAYVITNYPLCAIADGCTSKSRYCMLRWVGSDVCICSWH